MKSFKAPSLIVRMKRSTLAFILGAIALQQRGTFFVDPNADCYEGMILGENAKEGDLVVNVQKAKQLTNVRSSGTDKSLKIAPAKKMSLEETLEYIADDELVEVTPKNIRLRKKLLTENERKRARPPKA